jgi:hypothetical protein
MASNAPKALNTEQAARRFAAVLRAVLSAPPDARNMRKTTAPEPQKADRKQAARKPR